MTQFQKMINAPEFYPKTSKKLSFLHHEILLHLCQLSENSWRNAESLEKLYDETYKALVRRRSYKWSEQALGHIKGIRRLMYDARDISAMVHILLDILPSQRWVSIENLLKYAFLKELDFEIYSTYNVKSNLVVEINVPEQEEGGSRGYYSGHSDHAIDNHQKYFDIIIAPLIRSAYWTLGCLGLVDIAYTEPKNSEVQLKGQEYLTPFDGIAFVAYQ